MAPNAAIAISCTDLLELSSVDRPFAGSHLCHCEERSDEAISIGRVVDCFATLAMTSGALLNYSAYLLAKSSAGAFRAQDGVFVDVLLPIRRRIQHGLAATAVLDRHLP